MQNQQPSKESQVKETSKESMPVNPYKDKWFKYGSALNRFDNITSIEQSASKNTIWFDLCGQRYTVQSSNYRLFQTLVVFYEYILKNACLS
jgi:hypothetical protein